MSAFCCCICMCVVFFYDFVHSHRMYALGLHDLSNVISMVNMSPFHFVDAQARFHSFLLFITRIFRTTIFLSITFLRSYFQQNASFKLCIQSIVQKNAKEMWFLGCWKPILPITAIWCQFFLLFHTQNFSQKNHIGTNRNQFGVEEF